MNRLALTLPGGKVIYDPQSRFNNLGEFISGLYQVIFYVSLALALYWLTWGIFEYIFAGGDKEKLASGRKKITWVIVGLMFILLAFLIAQFAGQVLLPEGSNQPFESLPISE